MTSATPRPGALPEPSELDPIVQANRRAKGKRPHFINDPAVERVLSITMAIAGELSVARERLDTLEKLLIARGVLSETDIDSFVPDEAAQTARNEWGRAYIARVLRILDQDVQALAGAPEASMEQLQDELGRPAKA